MKRFMSRLLVLMVLSAATAAWFVARPAFWQTDSPGEITLPSSADPRRLHQHVNQLVSGFGARSYRHPDNLDRISGYVASQLELSGARVSFQPFDVPEGRYRNVIARYGPATGPLVVIGAHYDTADDLPGADDNASGVAGLLELGRLLGQVHLRQPIELVAFTLEEPPFFGTDLMGSAIYADSLKSAGVEVELMISMEMIGYYNEAPGSQRYPFAMMNWLYPDAGDFIAIIDRGFSPAGQRLRESFRHFTSMPAYSINAPAMMEGIHFSDHRNFWFHDYPAVMVTNTAYLRNPSYHTAQDTPDRLDYERMAEVVEGVLQHVLQENVGL